VMPERVASESDFFRHMRKRYLAGFILLGLLAICSFLVAWYFITGAKYAGSEVFWVGICRFLSRRISYQSLELFINDGNSGLTRYQVAKDMIDDINSFQMTYSSLLSGNSSMRLPGMLGRYPPLSKLLYQYSCMRVDKDCNKDRLAKLKDASAVVNGLDHLITTYFDVARRILKSVDGLTADGDFNPNSAQLMSTARPVPNYSVPAITALSADMTILQQVYVDYLDPGLDTGVGYLVEESRTRISQARLAQALILMGALISVVAVYLVIFRPMIRDLKEECGRSNQLLKMLPRQVLQTTKGLRKFSTVNGLAMKLDKGNDVQEGEEG